MNIFSKKINESEVALVKLQEHFEILNTDFASVQEQLVSMTEQTNTYKSEFERVDAENKELKEQLEAFKMEVEEVQMEVAEVTVDAVLTQEMVAQKAITMISELGHAPVEVLEDSDSIEKPKILTVLEQLKTLKNTELKDFYNSNKKEIMAALKNK